MQNAQQIMANYHYWLLYRCSGGEGGLVGRGDWWGGGTGGEGGLVGRGDWWGGGETGEEEGRLVGRGDWWGGGTGIYLKSPLLPPFLQEF